MQSLLSNVNNKIVDTIRRAEARSILSPVSGFIAQAGFTHSLSPARNCTFGCTYCYVPTLGVYGGLKPEDWQHWGKFSTFKSNAAKLLPRELRPGQRIYCSPLVDPYQPAEETEQMMPKILAAVLERPPRVFTIQTRGSLILRDVELLRAIASRTTLRVSFSIPSNRDEILKWYEPHCSAFEERIGVIRTLRQNGLEVHATLAPLLPCDPEELVRACAEASGREPLGDPLHVRAVKRSGATTREAAFKIAGARGHMEWFDPGFQEHVIARIRRVCPGFLIGPAGFARLAV